MKGGRSSLAKLGLIAGEGELPALVARNASGLGNEVVVVSLSDKLDPQVSSAASRIYRVDLTDASTILPILKNEGVTQVVMIGKVWRAAGFERKAWRAIQEVTPGKRDGADTSVLAAFVKGLEAEGIVVLGQLLYLGDAVPREGVLGRRSPSPAEWEDVQFGFAMAKHIAGARIGQAVVVKDRTVVAVEAAEGTDDMIRRAGHMAPGCVVVKVAWPGQDDRFDVPAVGPDTVEVMRQMKAAVLAVEADRTIVVRRDDVIALADAAGIAVVAVKSANGRTEQEERGAGGA